MKKIFSIFSGFALMLAFAAVPSFATGGFNQYGYNYTARVFEGPLSGWCQEKGISLTTCGGYGFGSANDQLVMKWNAQWDNCNANGYDNPTDCLGAWVDNEFNGHVPGGSGVVWHYKIIWVGSAGDASPYWQPGGYSVWGNYEVVMDQGTNATGHVWYANATPNGYGSVFAQ